MKKKFKNGMRILDEHKLVPISMLRDDAPYQRPEIESIITGFVKSFTKFQPHLGPYPVNHLYQKIDGKQRTNALKRMGITHVYVTRYEFETPELEAEFFRLLNTQMKSLTPEQYMSASVAAADPYHVLFNNIIDSPTCVLSKMVRHTRVNAAKKQKGQPSPYTNEFGINEGRTILNFLGLGVQHRWTKEKQETVLSERALTANQQDIEESINEFFTQFFSPIFPYGKSKDKEAHSQDGMITIMQLYLKAKANGFLSTPSQRKAFTDRMMSFKFDANWKAKTPSVRLSDLMAHFDARKHAGKTLFNKAA